MHAEAPFRNLMPREVALEFLCDPRVKLTNCFRKVCADARDEVVCIPIVKPKTAEVRFTAKLRTLPLAKLVQIRTRCDRRSDKCFNAALKVSASAMPERAKARLVEHLSGQSQKFDFLHGLTTAEIQRRVESARQIKL